MTVVRNSTSGVPARLRSSSLSSRPGSSFSGLGNCRIIRSPGELLTAPMSWPPGEWRASVYALPRSFWSACRNGGCSIVTTSVKKTRRGVTSFASFRAVFGGSGWHDPCASRLQDSLGCFELVIAGRNVRCPQTHWGALFPISVPFYDCCPCRGRTCFRCVRNLMSSRHAYR